MSDIYDKSNRIYIAIDLKSFYASVECSERGLDPLNTNLVVADASRTEKTIVLAVSPPLKAYGIPGRPRLFEVVEAVKHINAARLADYTAFSGEKDFRGSSYLADTLANDRSLKLDYIVAPPRMSTYMKYSADIFRIYLKYFSHEDMHVYSCDEVFIDITDYMTIYKTTPEELTRKIIREVLDTTGITATAGIGTNLFLCKIAMDIWAKHTEADEYGVRIAYLDEAQYRKSLWGYKPLTAFWRVGPGTARRLAKHGIFTMGDIARCSEQDEELLYRLFGVNAELLIDHAWGYEPCTISDIKAYQPMSTSISSGQVLSRPYLNREARIVIREMADAISLELVDKGLESDQIVIYVGYDTEALSDPDKASRYKGEVVTDHYGRKAPKPAGGSINLGGFSSSTVLIADKAVELYDEITDPSLTVRRLNITMCHTRSYEEYKDEPVYEQMDLFTDYEARLKDEKQKEKEKALQLATLELKKRFGKNAVIKGTDLQQGATSIERNSMIGGHKG